MPTENEEDIAALFAATPGEEPREDEELEVEEPEDPVEYDEPLPSRWWTGEWSRGGGR